MSSYVQIALYPLAACLIGLALGWIMRMRSQREQAGTKNDLEQAREQLQRLRELTRSVAADVDQHSALMRQIGDELNSGVHDGEVVSAVARLIQANQRMHTQLGLAETRLEAQARQIETSSKEARTDALTQVANRRSFDDELRRSVAEFQRRGRPSALMLVDVDHFKRFNDTHGHQAGDEVLRGVAKVLRQMTGETELVARYGGEEFAVLFVGSPMSTARQLGETARKAIAATTFHFHGRAMRVTASAGVAELQAADDERSILRRADEALYAAKHAGRNCGYWHGGDSSHLIELAPPPPAADVTTLGDGTELKTNLPQIPVRDTLASLSTPQIFFEDLVRRLAYSKRGTAPMSLLLLQVDRVGRIQTEQGPSGVQRVIRIAAQLLKASMREMDHLSRISDDTFALLLPGASLNDSASVAERVRKSVERCRLPKQAGSVPSFTVSVGCVEANETDDMRHLMERARKALEAAVHQGRNGTFVHDGTTVRDVEELQLVPR